MTLTTADQALVQAAEVGDVPSMSAALVGSGPAGTEEALKAATVGKHAECVQLLLERGALAAAIGAFSSALHRPGLTMERRIETMLLLLAYYQDAGPPGKYHLAISKVLLAGAAQREGPLLLAALVRAGHLAGTVDETGCKKAQQLSKRAVQISWSVARQTGDGVICDQVRVPIRRHYPGYRLASQQLQLIAAAAAGVPWSPAMHKAYPLYFRSASFCLLCCWRREPLCKLPDEVALCVLEQLAALTFWEAPDVDVDEGWDICVEHGQPLSKLPSYKSLQ